MVEIPHQLHCLFSTTIESDEDSYVISVPKNEVEQGRLSPNQSVKVGLLKAESRSSGPDESTTSGTTDDPPIKEGENRRVTISSLGDKGDGIAKIGGGYTLIVPGADVGEEVNVVVTAVRDTHAFTRTVNDVQSG